MPIELKARLRTRLVSSVQRVQRLDESLVYYNSFQGQFSDSPRALYEQLTASRPALRHVWRSSPEHRESFPPALSTLRPGTFEHATAVARAKWIIANTWMSTTTKTRGTVWVQTWHGTPLKRIAFDAVSGVTTEGAHLMRQDVQKWDYLLSPNPFSTGLFRKAFRYEGPILETGYPRNDVLNAPERERLRASVREGLGIPDDRVAVLYAPTWRDEPREAGGGRSFPMPFDLDAVDEALGDSHVLLLRLHRAIRASEADSSKRFVRNVSRYPDIRDLYLAADVLVTDYSSVMFDFAITGKPMLFYTFDLATYRDDLRGFYFDFEAEAPGPLLHETADLIEALRSATTGEPASTDRYRAFREKFCPLDDGHAARRVAEAVFDSSGEYVAT